MKILNEAKKVITIKELEISDTLNDLESGELIDFEELLKEQYSMGDCVKVVITKVVRSED